MNDTSINLNLARKWRSKNFDQVVGQPLSVRMLKNSLYLDSYFPVYLFSGQRGCGKTTTARVFAASINCAQLPEFQKNPKINMVPCLQCASCIAMQAGKHPDFIEIDAASHTGVDNVRNIIDAASMLPLLGRKKIYLIDEAHMLSKAAFNAFLKILEEPPASVLFILATTDPHKIIDTVKSRCFQLFFTAVAAENLTHHLAHVCETEHINYDTAGLQLIVKESEGSVRDALNILEQVRFASSSVSKNAVQQILGHLDDQRLINLATIVLRQGPLELLRYMQEIKIAQFSAIFIWHKLVEFMRVCLWHKYGVMPAETEYEQNDVKKIVTKCSLAHINNALEQLYTHENMLVKTTEQHAVLEMILLSLCKKNKDTSDSGAAPATAQTTVVGEMIEILDSEQVPDENDESEDEDNQNEAAYLKSWHAFVKDVESLRDPLLVSLFKQGVCQSYDAGAGQLTVNFSKELHFFSDWLSGTQAQWQPLLNKFFNVSVQLKVVFEGDAHKAAVKVPSLNEQKIQAPKPTLKVGASVLPTTVPKTAAVQTHKNFTGRSQSFQTNKFSVKPTANGNLLDVSDVEVWKKTNLVLHYFPGVAREVKAGGYEHKI